MRPSRVPSTGERALGAISTGVWFLFVSACVFIPLIALMGAALGGSGKATGEAVLRSLQDERTLRLFAMTLGQASLSTVVVALLGIPGGMILGQVLQHRGWVQRLIPVLLMIPFLAPTVVTALVVIQGLEWLSPSLLYSLPAVILAHALINVPWMALRVGQARAEIPEERLWAARTLGASPTQVGKWVIWPEVRSAALLAGLQVFSLCAMSFALVLLLGGGPPVETLETGIYSRLRLGERDLPGALACALLQLLVVGVPTFWLSSKKRARSSTAVSGRSKAPIGRSLKPLLAVILSALPVIPFLGFLITALPGLSKISGYAPSWWLSIQLALGSSLLALGGVLGGLYGAERLGWGRWMAWSLSLPSGISILVLSLGFFLAYSRWVDPYEGSALLIMAIQATSVAPLVYRSLAPLAENGPPSAYWMARLCGAGVWRAFWVVEWPRWRGPLLSAFALGLGLSIGELAAVSLFYSEHLVPLPLWISRLMGQYRFDEALGVAALLLLTSIACTGAALGFGAFGPETRERAA